MAAQLSQFGNSLYNTDRNSPGVLRQQALLQYILVRAWMILPVTLCAVFFMSRIDDTLIDFLKARGSVVKREVRRWYVGMLQSEGIDATAARRTLFSLIDRAEFLKAALQYSLLTSFSCRMIDGAEAFNDDCTRINRILETTVDLALRDVTVGSDQCLAVHRIEPVRVVQIRLAL